MGAVYEGRQTKLNPEGRVKITDFGLAKKFG